MGFRRRDTGAGRLLGQPRLQLTARRERAGFDQTVDTRPVGPGQQASFTRSCDELRALVLDDADLQIIGGLGPETSSDVLRIDDEYECGDEIIFTFTHSALMLDFDVSWTVIPSPPLVLTGID